MAFLAPARRRPKGNITGMAPEGHEPSPPAFCLKNGARWRPWQKPPARSISTRTTVCCPKGKTSPTLQTMHTRTGDSSSKSNSHSTTRRPAMKSATILRLMANERPTRPPRETSIKRIAQKLTSIWMWPKYRRMVWNCRPKNDYKRCYQRPTRLPMRQISLSPLQQQLV